MFHAHIEERRADDAYRYSHSYVLSDSVWRRQLESADRGEKQLVVSGGHLILVDWIDKEVVFGLFVCRNVNWFLMKLGGRT